MNKLYKYMKLSKKEYIIGLVLMIISTFLLTYTSYIISKIFDNNYSKAVKYVAIFFFINIIAAVLDYYKKYYLVKASNNLYLKIQTSIYDHIQKLEISYFDNISAGAIISRIISDVILLKNFFENTLMYIFAVIVKLIFIYLILFFVNYRMALVLVIFLIFMLFIKVIYEKLVYKYAKKYREYNSYCTALINEGIHNIDIIKMYNNEENIKNEWKEKSNMRMKVAKKIVAIDAKLLHNLTALSRDIIFILIILYYGYLKFNNLNYIEIGSIYLFMKYTLDVIDVVTNLVINLSSYTKAIAASNNIDEIFKLKNIDNNFTANNIENIKGEIEFKNVSFNYDNKNQVLKNVSFKIKDKSIVAFVGRTGSGKSTIINLLEKFYTNYTGDIYVDGHDIKDINVRNNIAMVLQEPFLFQGTVIENISINENNMKESVKNLKEITYDLKSEQNISNLSSGEKQLVSFARAMSKKSSILILDEATSNIDSETENIMQRSIENFRKKGTVIIIAHRLSTIKNADMIFVLDKGEIVESGTHIELIEKHGLYYAMQKKV
ncbi:ABC transporter ATP-binding protein [Oceanivirga salmonicida]|uniref:ABC transporter ATP-binding protein n=1 Tax=Oceanivirga salmonicida TaxID=1769291 RepID=UPI00082A72F9|nr:ABC transporter ATP-binding protein [Oceanivirga salmonicida]